MDFTTLQLRPCALALTPLVPAWLCAVANGHPAPHVLADLTVGIIDLNLPYESTRALARWLAEPKVTKARLQQVFSLAHHDDSGHYLERAAITCSREPSTASTTALLCAGIAIGSRGLAEAYVDTYRLPRPEDVARATKTLFSDVLTPAHGDLGTTGPRTTDVEAPSKPHHAGADAASSALPDVLEPPMPHPLDLLAGALPLSGLPEASPTLLRGLAASLSLSAKEKLRILNVLGDLSARQRKQLEQTFIDEQRKFRALDDHHHRALRKLVIEHAVDWFRLRDHYREMVPTCSAAEKNVR